MLFRRINFENNHFVSYAMPHIKCTKLLNTVEKPLLMNAVSLLLSPCPFCLWFLSSRLPLSLPCSRSSVTWRLQWQMAPAEEAPQPTGRPPTAADAPRPCRLAQQTTTARPTSLSTTCPRTWPRRSFAACSAASARSSPASWFATRSQVLNENLLSDIAACVLSLH